MSRPSTAEHAELRNQMEARERTVRTVLAAEDARVARIARMLHDGVAQYVPALQLSLSGFQRELERGTNTHATLQSLHAITGAIGEELYKVTLQLRSPPDDQGLVLALTSFLGEWSRVTNTAVDFDHVALGQHPLARSLESDVFRIVRDMLPVVSAPTQRARTSVSLRRQLDCVVVVVEHTGGADQGHQAVGGDFLASAKARVAFLGGTFTVENEWPGTRTLIARVPADRER